VGDPWGAGGAHHLAVTCRDCGKSRALALWSDYEERAKGWPVDDILVIAPDLLTADEAVDSFAFRVAHAGHRIVYERGIFFP